jgi:hypothetical protein
MRSVLLIAVLLSFSSCMTKKRAVRLIDKISTEYPELMHFDTTIVDTVNCDTTIFVNVPCDTLVTMLPGDTIIIEDIVYVKDTSGRITASIPVLQPPKVIRRTIRQTLTPACPPHKKSQLDIFLKWSGILFWLSLILLIPFRWQPSMK